MQEMNRDEIEKLIQQNPHLKEYLDSLRERMGMPKFFKAPPMELSEEKFPNIIYPTKGSVFVHIYRLPGMEEIEYHAIEPSLGEEEKKLKDKVMKLMLRDVVKKDIPEGDDGLRKVLKELLDEIIITTESDVKIKSSRGISKLLGKSENKIYMKPHEKERLEYEIMKTLVGGGPLEPFMRDPYIEDIHVITGEYVHLIHKVFGMIKTNVMIPKDEAPRFTRALSEKMGNPVSEAKPISDGILPDGSRANIIYSSAVSIKGPSMSIRKFTEVPISVTQLIKWKTISAGIAAYFWICLQYGRNIILCGETACGKT
ncbi:MAG: type II/IV secretion system ATPase subunit, partial [Thermoplasmata archaeon]|nr:type II/IV secretion system ATPase subunit [Thermoplasmata archaeon]